MSKYVVSFGWDLGCDQIVVDYQKTFDSKENAELFQSLIWRNNTKEYDICRTELIDRN
jgi:hypothetical protein